jgi:hypothetical protein
MLLCLAAQVNAPARGFGGAHHTAAVGPRGGVAVSHGYGGAHVGPHGAGIAGAHAGTYVGPRGTVVHGGQIGGAHVGPLGGVHAGGAQGVRVTTPGGRTFATGSAGVAGVGPYGGFHAAGARGTVASGPFGAVAGAYRGGVAIGGHGAVAVGHATRFVSPAALSYHAGFVRAGGFYGSSFNTGWYSAHPLAWRPALWRTPNIWIGPAWPALAGFIGVAAAAPILYDFGSNVVIQNNFVYQDGEPTFPADQFAQQAIGFADAGRQANPGADVEWQPLGVFGLVQGDEKTAQNIFQLAINSSGVIRGNYYDAVADNNLPVYGSVDPKTQRAAWSIGDKKGVVFEAGINNLTQEQTPVLVHYGTDRTQQMLLVRLQEDKK